MTALEAGCRQTPEKGTAIGLSGTIFTTNAVTIVDPSEGKPDDSNGSLPTPAIAGISVGVVIVIMVAIGLIVLHCQREKTFHDNWEYEYYDSYAPRRQPPLKSKQSPMAAPNNAYYIRNNPVEKRQPYVSSGEYYDLMEQEAQRGRTGYPMRDLDPKSSSPPTTTGLPTHPAYDPRTVSRNAGSETTARDLSAPPSIHKRIRSNTPDSFAIQAYLNAAEESARMAANSSSKASSPAVVSTQSATSPHNTTNTNTTNKLSTRLNALSLPKILVPKKRSSPQFIMQPPSSEHRDHQGDKNISRPVLASEEPRFRDSPVGGRTAVVSEMPRPPTPEEESNYLSEYREVQLKSGKSTLYGL
jgi:Tfp pilus assembly protein PilX